ncbi:MAG: CHAT domain-containing protein [Acidobacteriota bacterium]
MINQPCDAAASETVAPPATYTIEVRPLVDGVASAPRHGTLKLLAPLPGDESDLRLELSTETLDRPGDLTWSSWIPDRFGFGLRTTSLRLDGRRLDAQLLDGQPTALFPTWVLQAPPPVAGVAPPPGLTGFAVATDGHATFELDAEQIRGTIELTGLADFDRSRRSYRAELEGRRVATPAPATEGDGAAEPPPEVRASKAAPELGGPHLIQPLDLVTIGNALHLLLRDETLDDGLAALEQALHRQHKASHPSEPVELLGLERLDLDALSSARQSRLAVALAHRQVILRGLALGYFRRGDTRRVLPALVAWVEAEEILHSLRVGGQPLPLALPHGLEAHAGLQELLDQWRGGSTSEDLEGRIAILDTGQAFYERYLDFLLATEDEPSVLALETLEVAEAARARVLADQLTAAGDRTFGLPAGTARPPHVGDLRRLVVDRGAAVLKYFALETRLLLWLIQPSGTVDLVIVPIGRDELRSLVGELRPLLEAHRFDRAVVPHLHRLLRRLHASLIEPIPAHRLPAPGQPLTIVPHDALFQLPFGALRDADGRFLIERWPLDSSPSLALLERTTDERERPWPPRLLALLDPPSADPRFPPLPELAALGPQMTSLYAPRSRILIGPAATLEALEAGTGGADVVLLGSHALARDPQRGDASVLVLAPTDDSDGLLTTDGVTQLGLDAQLVVLAACQTGAGEVSSDGVFSLGRAFLVSGARALMVSLWDLPVEETTDLLDRFHQLWLGEGLAPARALQLAQAEQARRRPEQPGLWAGMTLIGGTPR